MLEKRDAEESEDTREWLRAESVRGRLVFTAGRRRLTGRMLHAAGRHHRRRTFVIRLVADLVQPVVQLRRSGERGRDDDRGEEERSADAAKRHERECASIVALRQLDVKQRSSSGDPDARATNLDSA